MKKIQLFCTIFLSVAVLSLTAIGCGNSQNKKTDSAATRTSSDIIQVDDLLANADQYVDKALKLEGVCTHICKHGGGKIFLLGSDDTKTIRIEAGDKVRSFKPETVNAIVQIDGTLKEQRIDEAYLSKWEAQLKSHEGHDHADGEEGCGAEQQANNEAPANSTGQRIANFRKSIAERKASEGKEYLSFYYVEADDYTIL